MMKQEPIHSSIASNTLYREPLDLGGISLTALDLCEHTLVTGATGTGKTRSFLLPAVETILRHFGTAAEEKAGMFLVDAKGDMAELALKCARRAGREEDVFILGEGGNCWFPLLESFGGDVVQIADFLFEVLENRKSNGGGVNESYWQENTRRLLRAAAAIAKSAHGNDLGGLAGLAEALRNICRCKEYEKDDLDFDTPRKKVWQFEDNGRITQIEANEVREYIEQDIEHLPETTWGCITNMARNYIAQFAQASLRMIFDDTPGVRKIFPEEIMDKGALMIVSLSPVIYGEAAAPFRLAVKNAFCQRMLQRPHLSAIEQGGSRPINQTRPVLFVSDEFHTTLSKGNLGEAYFLDRAREFRCMCMLATQGVSAISSVLNSSALCDHLLNNCRTKVFFANDCPATYRYFEELGGDEDRDVEMETHVPQTAPARFRLPNHTFAPYQPMLLSSRSRDKRRVPRFDSSKLGSLPNGTAWVVTKGRKLHTYHRSPSEYL